MKLLTLMSEDNKEELIKAQNEVIGILFEIIKRYQANNDLDEEFFQLVSADRSKIDKNNVENILKKRKENAKIISRLLGKLET